MSTETTRRLSYCAVILFLFLEGYGAVSYLLSKRPSHRAISHQVLPAEKNQGYQVLIFDGIEPASGK